MDIIQQIELEVQQLADEMTVDVILMLIDKWDNDINNLRAANKLTMTHALSHYARLKVAVHHIRKRIEYYDWDDAWSRTSTDDETKLICGLEDKIRKARRDYYVAKRRYEGEHASGCTCRGCRYLGQIPWDRANEACAIPSGA